MSTETPEQATPHLWEIDHPYYCADGNHYVGSAKRHEVHTSYESWQDFIEEWGDTDHDMNLVFRWDWKRTDPDDLDEGEEPGPDSLQVFWVLQRKAILRSTHCTVTPEDEPAVRAWLAERAKTITALWAPFDLSVSSGEAESA